MFKCASKHPAMSLVFAMCLVVSMSLSIPAFAGSIYDSNVEKKLRLKSHQKKKVRNIIQQSDRKMRAVFRKYGIDPNGPPRIKKLKKAAKELRAIESQEIKKMSKVLTPEQFDKYRIILSETAARVRAEVR